MLGRASAITLRFLEDVTSASVPAVVRPLISYDSKGDVVKCSALEGGCCQHRDGCEEASSGKCRLLK